MPEIKAYCTNAHHCKHGKTCAKRLTSDVMANSRDKKDGRKIIKGTPYEVQRTPCERYEYVRRF